MPDDRLLDLAAQGKLHEPDTLREEVAPDDARPEVRRVCRFVPAPVAAIAASGHVPAGQEDLSRVRRVSGKEHGRPRPPAFFREVLEQNLPLREFLDSDWTMLNERLASHYGIAGVQGETTAARRAEAGRTIAAACSPRRRSWA